jgi:hypothetical protein
MTWSETKYAGRRSGQKLPLDGPRPNEDQRANREEARRRREDSSSIVENPAVAVEGARIGQTVSLL